MNEIKSLENYISYKQVCDDYPNLACHLYDFRMYKVGTEEHESTKKNCAHYLTSIIVNKHILGVDTTADEMLIDEIYNRL